MTISFRQTIYFFLLLFTVNIFAGIFNQTYNYAGSLKDVIEVAPGLIWVSFLFWVSCQWRPKTKLRIFFLPLLRILFWTLNVASGIWNNNRMSSEDFLYANSELFYWWTSLKILTPTVRNYNVFVELFLIDIFAIALGQILLIYTAIFMDGKLLLLKKTHNLDNGS
jgi:hypothetical protein